MPDPNRLANELAALCRKKLHKSRDAGAGGEHHARVRTDIMLRGDRRTVAAAILSFAMTLMACSHAARPMPVADGSAPESTKATASPSFSLPSPPAAVTPIVVAWREPDPNQPQPPGLSQLPICRANDLEFNDGDSNGAGGSIYLSVIIVNRTGPPCRLHGTPSVDLLDVDGAPTAISTKPASPEPNGHDVLLQPTAALFQAHFQFAPGAVLQLVWPSSVEGCLGNYVKFHQVRLRLPGVEESGTVTFPGQFTYSACARVAVAVGVMSAISSERQSSESSARLAATINAPSEVAPGGLLTYTVQLANWTHDELPATDYCPAFLQLLVPLGARYGAVAESAGRALNCDGLPVLPIAGTIVFEIHFPIPADAQLGSYNLVWAPVPGPYFAGQASARVNIEKSHPTPTPTR